MVDTVNLKINKVDVTVPSNKTIMEAAKSVNIDIPSLCIHKDLCILSTCRVCVVEVEGYDELPASCSTLVSEGMVVYTNSALVREARKVNIELLLSEHNYECITCPKNIDCELRKLSAKYSKTVQTNNVSKKIDNSSDAFIRDLNRCIKCRRCVSVCSDIQSVNALSVYGKGREYSVEGAYNKNISLTSCVDCGQCILRCPTAALSDKTDLNSLWSFLNDNTKKVVLQILPSVFSSIVQYYKLYNIDDIEGRLITAFKLMGFDKVFCSSVATDIMVIESAYELLSRLSSLLNKENNIVFPMMSSASHAFVKHLEKSMPSLLANLSTTKSVQQIFGSLIKSYYAEKSHIAVSDIVTVSVSSCVASKSEALRDAMQSKGSRDIDFSINTRDLVKMIDEFGVNIADLMHSKYDDLGAVISMNSSIISRPGGLAESVLTLLYEIITGSRTLPGSFDITHNSVLKFSNVKSEWKIFEGFELKLGLINGIADFTKLLDNEDLTGYHYIEAVSCVGGCLNGGGQALGTTLENDSFRENFYKKLQLQEPDLYIYDEYLEKPNSRKAMHLFHTHFIPSKKQIIV